MQLTYKAKYKQPGDWFWKPLLRSLILTADTNGQFNKILHFPDGSEMHLPYFTNFKYGKERLQVIAKNAEKKTGQKVNIG